MQKLGSERRNKSNLLGSGIQTGKSTNWVELWDGIKKWISIIIWFASFSVQQYFQVFCQSLPP